MFCKINATGDGLIWSETKKDGYKRLISQPYPTYKIEGGFKWVNVLKETEENIISDWEIVKKTTQDKLDELEYGKDHKGKGFLKKPWVKQPSLVVMGYFTGEKAKERALELREIHPQYVKGIHKYDFNTNEYGILISEEVVESLTESEKSRVRLLDRILGIETYYPPVYRYLDEKYIDEFFSSGKLRLSTFKKFYIHENDQQRDVDEGYCVVEVRDEDTCRAFKSEIGLGINSYVLCASLKNSEDLAKAFNVNSCFVIEKPFAFAQIIANKLQDVLNVRLGPCRYMPDRTIKTHNLPKQYFEAMDYVFDKERNAYNHELLTYLTSVAAGTEVFFRKKDIYENQQEFRFIWDIDAPELPEHIDIIVPEAIQLCRKTKTWNQR